MYMLYFILFIMYICLYVSLSFVTKTLFWSPSSTEPRVLLFLIGWEGGGIFLFKRKKTHPYCCFYTSFLHCLTHSFLMAHIWEVDGGSASVSMRYRRSGFMVVGSLSYAVVAYGWDQSFLPHQHTSQITFLVPDWWPLLLTFYCRLYLQWKLPI